MNIEQQCAFAAWQRAQDPRQYPAERQAFEAGWAAALQSQNREESSRAEPLKARDDAHTTPVTSYPSIDHFAPLARAVGYDTPSDGELRGVIKCLGYGHLVESGQVDISGNEVIDIVRAFASPERLRTTVAEAGGSA